MSKTAFVVSNTAWSIEKFRLPLIKELILLNYRVICIADNDRYLKGNIDNITGTGAEFINIKLGRSISDAFYDINYILKNYYLLKKVRPDIVFSFTVKPNIYFASLAKKFGIKIICTINGLGSGMLNRSIISRLQRLLYRASLKNIKYVLFQNRSDLEYFREEKIIGKENGFIVNGSGVDTDYFTPGQKLSWENVRVAYIGRLLKHKGIREYIDVAGRLNHLNKNLEFIVIGHHDPGNPSAVNRKLIEDSCRKGIIRKLHFRDNIKEFLHEVHIVALPSYREGLSMTLLEAASCEKVIIASDVPGCSDIIDHNESGFLFRARSADSMQECLNEVLNSDTNKLEQIGRKARIKAQSEFSVRRVLDQYISYL